MAFASTYPAAKAAIIALWRSACASPIINGPTIGAGLDAVGTVGYQDETNPLAAEGGMVTEVFGGIPRREQYTINCSAAINWGSTTPIADAEAAVFALFNALGGALTANTTLGVPGVLTAGIDRWQLPEQQGADGLTMVLKFTVAIDAVTTV
jgi:hypothetical protein